MTSDRKPLVTIGIPTYNRAGGLLRFALESALAQTYPKLEIIVSDNCSTDGTEDLVRSYDDPRLHYVKQEHNLGANGNFNFCVQSAHGAYFLLLHDDDLIDPDFVEVCIEAADGRTDIGFIHTGNRLIDGDGTVLAEHPIRGFTPGPAGFALDWFGQKFGVYLCSTLYNTEGLQRIGGFDPGHQLVEDLLACAELAVASGRVAVSDVKASFRNHEANKGAGADYAAWCKDSQEFLDRTCRLLPDDAERLTAAGKPFLCRMNFDIARRTPSVWRRVNAYFGVARAFDYAASPIEYAIKRDFKPRLRRMKRRFRH